MIRALFLLFALAGSLFGATGPAFAGEEGRLDNREAAELLSASVVQMSDGGRGMCSASKIGPISYLTAGHCVRALGARYRLEHPDTLYQYVGSVTVGLSNKLAGSLREDWAVLTVTKENTDLPALELACDEDLYLGMPVAYAGYPENVDFAYGTGYVASLNHIKGGRNNADFAVDLQAAPGASGAPIISLDTGRIVGVLTEGVISRRFGPYLVGAEHISNIDLCANRSEDGEGHGPKVRSTEEAPV